MPPPESSAAPKSETGLPTPKLPAPGPVSARPSQSDESMGSKLARMEPPSHRDEIPIQDFQLLRRIGSGSYGEVWLARAITGAMRAVKIVWREDFEYEKTFRREFEGIQQFEPISRGHQGLVDVLHVGWNEGRGYYYYVMELADDAEHGTDIDPQHYTPRTLSSDFKIHGRLNLPFCREAGIFLADALGYMHSYGLTHRDIKPSNIIFVGGVCKLADIGLVATHGERSFVGTEGFVPPEGPGTFAADIYSLGKVLYEISSGKDRMEFPEVPDDLNDGELEYWRDWNRVICRACAPMVADRYSSAAEFANELRQVGVPKPVPFSRRASRVIAQISISAIVAGSALSMATHQREWRIEMPAPDGKLSPEEIARMRLPVDGQMWMNKASMRFPWRADVKQHIADKPVNLELFTAFLEDTMRPFEGEVVPWSTKGSKTEYAVVVPAQDADAFCDWLAMEDRSNGSLNDDYEYRWKPDATVKQSTGAKQHWSALRLELARLHFGDVEITTVPEDADVLIKGQSLGYTPQVLTRQRVGDVTYEIRLPGYKPEFLHGKVTEGKPLKLHADLKLTHAVVFGKKWTNSLGMELAPLGEVMMSTAETRRSDYAEFYRHMVYTNVPPVPLDSEMDLPMTFVNRNEAQAFCRWLTQQERKNQLLESNQSYRLPTDDEWSMAAGLPREKGGSPSGRNSRIQGMYPWGGFEWPPNPPAGNFWDTTAADATHKKDGIPNYTDNFPMLAPVRSFPMDPHTEIYDLAGNVWEWVLEDMGGNDPKQQHLGVVRGGSWRTKDRLEMLASFRRPVTSAMRADDIGFRVVLSTDGVKAREEE